MDRSLNLDELHDLPPARLAPLLDPDADVDWPVADAADALRHQLASPLLPDLIAVPGVEPSRLEALLVTQPQVVSFLDALTTGAPTPAVLQAIKAFARHVDPLAAHPLHGSPARVLYFAAIAAALRGGVRMSQLPDAALREGFVFGANCPGAEGLRTLFERAIAQLGAGAGG